MQEKKKINLLLLNHCSHSFTGIRFFVIIIGLTCLHLYNHGVGVVLLVLFFFWSFLDKGNTLAQEGTQGFPVHVASRTTCSTVPVPTIHVCPHPPPSEQSPRAQLHLPESAHSWEAFPVPGSHGADGKHLHCLIHHC